jgi:hypothetical protein
MTRAQRTAYRLRHLILVAGCLFTSFGVIWSIPPLAEKLFGFKDSNGLLGTVLILNPFTVYGDGNNSELYYYANLAAVVGWIILAQWAFLRPGKGWKIQVNTVGRPMKTSVFAAALMAMLLTTGMIALLLELPNWWQPVMEYEHESRFYPGHIMIWIIMLVIWGAWSGIFFVYWKQGDQYTQMGKMIRGLVAGSILETIIAVPVQIWVTRQRDCYCCSGSYSSLILAATVLIWAFGPGIIILYMREKRRVEKLNSPGKD